MKTFKDLAFKSHPNMPGLQAKMIFDNGYGVSVVRFNLPSGLGYGSYTDNEDEWEVAIVKGTEDNADICYDTPITDDVFGHLLENEVTEIMEKVQLLPAYNFQPENSTP